MTSTPPSGRAPKRRGALGLLPATALATLGLGAGLIAGCNGIGSGDSSDDECVSTREFFANEILGGAMAKCSGCHEPGGLADEQNAEFRLWPSAYPGFIDANFESVTEMAKNQYDGVPLLLAKPSGLTEHGGGTVLEEGSEEYQAIEELIAQLDEPVECESDGDETTIDGVELLTATETLRKATLHLLGRLPTTDEIAAVDAGGLAALEGMLESMMDEDAFFIRLTEMMNDRFLTDRYLIYTGFAVNLLNEEAWPNAGAPYDAIPDTDPDRFLINAAVAREPLDLISYIVKNDRPFTEILTADYTVFNKYSAQIYEPDGLSFGANDDYSVLKEGKLKVGSQTVPHAGILTSPMWLNRFPTTPTNRNRHRARMVLDMFLATDILKIAERPIDPSAPTNYNNPTLEDPRCTVCHTMIDPIAGAFQKYNENDYEIYDSNYEWHTDMFGPGFGDESIPTSEYGTAVQWLAAQIVEDPRFRTAMVTMMYKALTGLQPLDYPADGEAEDFSAKLDAWYAQEALFGQIAEDFELSDYNIKTVISGVILSPYFRAKNLEMPAEGADAALYEGMGNGRLSTPELLARKIEAVTGSRWVRGWDLRDYMTTDFLILYGGIDSDTITKRLDSMNGIMAGVAWRMANEVSCGTTAWDFIQPADERHMFPHVELSDLPEGVSGDPVPDAVDRIKENIRYLHLQVLGEDLDIEDPEIDATYQIFYDTWKEGVGLLESGGANAWLDWQCRGRVNPTTQVELPEAEQLTEDPFYTVRAWMAVMTYMLSDYRFLYE